MVIWSIVIFLVAILVRCAIILRAGPSVIGGEPLNIAKSLAADWRFAEAFGAGSGPTAHTMPLYPWLLSFVIRMFDGSPFLNQACQIFCSAAAALGFALLPFVAVAAQLNVSAGIVGGLAGALLPINFWAQSSGVFESSFTAAAIIALLLLVAPVFSDGRFDVYGGMKVGLAAGIACLFNPSVVPVLAVWVLVCLFRYPEQRWAVIRFSAAGAVFTVLLLTPWALRNRQVFGEWIWTRQNLGLELQVSHNDFATADLEYNVRQPWFHLVHPFGGKEEFARLRQLGEPAYNRAKMQEAFAWVAEHKRQFTTLTLDRFWLFWVPNMRRPLQSALEILLTLGGLAGLIQAMRKRLPCADMFAAIFIAYPVIYYFVQSSPRYRYPVEPLLFLLAAYFASGLWTRIVGRLAGVRS